MAEHNAADRSDDSIGQVADPSHTSHLLFPLASAPISKTLSSISKSHLSLSNRFASIASDAAFISTVASQLRNVSGAQLPVLANERCGSWYVDPQPKAGSAYFKSTDGHWGQWGFSLRRLNLQVLEVAGWRGGLVIVDSTRRGKRMYFLASCHCEPVLAIFVPRVNDPCCEVALIQLSMKTMELR